MNFVSWQTTTNLSIVSHFVCKRWHMLPFLGWGQISAIKPAFIIFFSIFNPQKLPEKIKEWSYYIHCNCSEDLLKSMEIRVTKAVRTRLNLCTIWTRYDFCNLYDLYDTPWHLTGTQRPFGLTQYSNHQSDFIFSSFQWEVLYKICAILYLIDPKFFKNLAKIYKNCSYND